MSSITHLRSPVDMSDVELDTYVHARGKCAGAEDDETFFPDREITVEEARAACAGCPVLAGCLELALRDEARAGGPPDGIRGGMTPDERYALIRNRRRRAQRAAARVDELAVAS